MVGYSYLKSYHFSTHISYAHIYREREGENMINLFISKKKLLCVMDQGNVFLKNNHLYDW